jgi:hypothetical protein
MFDLLVLGGLGVDIRVRVPAIPLPPADSIIVPPIDLRIGNTGAGVALAAHGIGLDVMVVDVLGEDATGDVARGRLTGRRAPQATDSLRSCETIPAAPAGRSTWLTRKAIGCPFTTRGGLTGRQRPSPLPTWRLWWRRPGTFTCP